MLRLTIGLAVLVLLAAPTPAAADSVTFSSVDPGATLPGYVSNDILVTVPGMWTGLQLLTADLPPGSIYQDPLGGNTPPNPGFLPTFPTLEYDTFKANGGLTRPPSGEVLEIGGAVNLGGAATEVFSDRQINATWSPPGGGDVVGAVDYPVGRVTFASSVNETFRLMLGSPTGNSTAFGVIENGVMRFAPPPASGTLSVLRNITVTNETATVQDYSFSILLPTDLAATETIAGSIATSLIDGGGDGATIAPLSGDSIYKGLIDDSVVATLQDDPFSLVAVPGATGATAATASFGPLPSDMTIHSSIGIQLDFTLTPGDSAAILSRFDVVAVPEPSALLLFGIGAFGLLAYARRKSS